MDLSQEIDKAIAAHSAWRQRLNVAISDGSSDFSVENVKLDNRCEFGKWFYGLPAAQRDSEHGRKIQELHAAFHVETARILALALAGQKDKARESMAAGSEFQSISGKLVISLTRWKQTA